MCWNSISGSFYWYYSIFNRTCSVIVSVYIEKELKLDPKIKTSIPTTLRRGRKPFSLLSIYIILYFFHIVNMFIYFLFLLKFLLYSYLECSNTNYDLGQNCKLIYIHNNHMVTFSFFGYNMD